MAVRTVEVTMTYKVPDLVSRVARGVALLDAKVPGWWKEIDIKELDLSANSACVVGQLAIKSMLNGPLDGYYGGIGKLFPKEAAKDDKIKNPTIPVSVGPEVEKASAKHGFDFTDVEMDEFANWIERQPADHPWKPEDGYYSADHIQNRVWDYLTQIWVQVVKERQQAARARKRAVKAVKKTTAKKTTAKAKAR